MPLCSRLRINRMLATVLLIATQPEILKVLADYAAMERLFQAKVEEWNQHNGLPDTLPDGQGDPLARMRQPNMTRSLIDGNGIVATSLSHVDQYGCWCYFSDDHGHGRGEPVNLVDEYCKYLHDGYECAIFDTAREGQHCVPWKIDYNPALNLGNEFRQLEYECRRKNPGNNCGIRACAVETFFILNIFSAFFSEYQFDPVPKHSYGIFDPKTECPTLKGGKGKREKDCCGEYPIRYPYRHLDGDRRCCGKRTYDTEIFECCDEDMSDVAYSCVI